MNCRDFIRSEHIHDDIHASVIAVECAFDPEAFSDSLFRDLGIPFPPSLRRAVPNRRAEFLAGRFCAKKALEVAAIDEQPILIGDDRSPVWPSGVRGSISHDGCRAIAALTDRDSVIGVGIDLIDIMEKPVALDVEHLVVSEAEIALSKVLSIDPLVFLTLAFSIKESFFKAAFPEIRRFFAFDAVEIRTVDVQGHFVELQVRSDMGSNLFEGRQVRGWFHQSGTQLDTLVVLDRRPASQPAVGLTPRWSLYPEQKSLWSGE